MPLYIALKRLQNGTNPDGSKRYLPPGSLVPSAANWRRLDVSIDRGEILVLGDDVIAAIRGTTPASEPAPTQDPSASAPATPTDSKRRASSAPGK